MTQPALILNVDDSEAGRYAKSRILSEAGFEVIECGTGAEALALALERHPALIVLDVQLPDLSGLEVCRRVKANPATQSIPIIQTSATFLTPEYELLSLEHGAEIYLTEPLEPRVLITVARTLLRLRASEMGLMAREESMRLATHGAGVATWDIDLPTGNATWSESLYAMLGYDEPLGTANWSKWRDRIHPDDLAAVEGALESARTDGLPFAKEHRVLRHDNGQERWLEGYGRVYPDKLGGVTRFLGVMVDITARKQFEMEREDLLRLELAARLEAEAAVRQKDEFLAMLSHELRTPLSSIFGLLYLLKTKGTLDKEQRKSLETIDRNALLQAQLINDLLDVSRIICGKLLLELETLSLDSLVEAALDSACVAAGAKNITVDRQLETSGSISGDPTRLQQILGNLLSNAVKFTPADGRIEVRTSQSGAFCKIEVTDTGEGIPAEFLPHIFDRFRQADASTTRRHGGLGLGLAIARHLTELHGGTLTGGSADAHPGAKFTLTLPLETDSGKAQSGESHAAADHPLNLEGVRVLVVEDNVDTRAIMAEVLTGHGVLVRTACSADEAVQVFSEWLPDISILDIGMPGENGYELLSRLKAVSPDVLAIAVTGYAGLDARLRSATTGFARHIAKPVDVPHLLKTISALARSRSIS